MTGAKKKPVDWTGPGGKVGSEILDLNDRCLAAYRENPALVEEHANAERIQTEGGYGRRQIWELVQNGADELLGRRGRVEVVLTEDHLYCANEGNPVTPAGAGAILSAYRSNKRGPEIGRFGLGFKSVLGVSTCPQFFSRSGSFGFAPKTSQEQISAVVKTAERVPTLRLATPLKPAEASEGDNVLTYLMSWATTVVRLPLDRGLGAWLHDDLASFPAAFLVFSPHISLLVLDDRTSARRREIALEGTKDPTKFRLAESGTEDVWRVFSDDFRPSAEAARDAGAMADREVIRFQWAVPVRSQQRTGRLWAYFPTLEETTLSGVLNAPWKLNDDRTRVMEGPFNREILDYASMLVLTNLDVLVTPDDPGNVLDILPARGREIRNWADGDLTELINDRAPSYPSISDQDGVLQAPKDLKMHPGDVPRRALLSWQKAPGRPADWVHPSIDANPTRRSRALRFIQASHGGPASVKTWLETLVPIPEPKSSAAAIIVAARIKPNDELFWNAHEARIVLTRDGDLCTCNEVYLPGDHRISAKDIKLVDAQLAKHEAVHAALRELGVRRVDPLLELDAFLNGVHVPNSEGDWETFWRLAGRAPAERVLKLLGEHRLGRDLLQVRVVAGSRARLVGTLLPGDVATAQDAPGSVIDVSHHKDELDLLRALGAVTAPAPGAGRIDEPPLHTFRRDATKTFLDSVGAARPDENLISIEERPFAGPVTPILDLPGEARARFTEALLRAQPTFERWEVRHSSDRYSAISVEHPILEAVREHGVAATKAGLLPAAEWVGPSLADWDVLLPVVGIPEEAARALQLPEELEDLSDEQWGAAFGRLQDAADTQLAARFYLAAARAGVPVPSTLVCGIAAAVTTRPPTDVRVATSPRHVDVLAASDIPSLLVASEDAAVLVSSWGLLLAADEIETEVVAIETTERVPLIDLFPALRLTLDDRARALDVARCSELSVDTYTADGRISEPTLFHIDQGVAYIDESMTQTMALQRFSAALSLDLTPSNIDQIIANRLSQESRRRLSEIKKRKTDAARLAAIVDTDTLRASLPHALITSVEDIHGELDHEGLARVALATHGVETLRKFTPDLERLGLQPPSSWAGSRRAIDFVGRLGFSGEYAGFEGGKRDRLLEVEGRPRLNDLHCYQRTVVTEIQLMLRGKVSKRGLVSLPTGAGKTRVAIQAIAELMRDEKFPSPILWVAQRDELCEQAVQAWSEIWRAIGPPERLTISRLWASNDAEQADSGHQVVVATIDKLDSGVIDAKSYGWLSKAPCLVIDEAHGATSPAYTHLLEWQGMGRNKERAPLLGLTATPYRGTSEVETKRLAARFGGVRLDEAAFGEDDPYRRLQDMGVLSRVQHRVLDGSELDLSAAEMAEVTRTRLLPASVSNRLAADVDRNMVLLDSVTSLDDDWTVLMFCTSVEHAQVMAALLSEAGISSAAISASTPPAARRHYVEAFRRREVRVLTNYAVFAAGFDAPKVRAVYVARPTYSPNVYQQMIGRGLRGPKNGGSEECLIVNVADNIVNFGEKLAFREFDHLWDSQATDE